MAREDEAIREQPPRARSPPRRARGRVRRLAGRGIRGRGERGAGADRRLRVPGSRARARAPRRQLGGPRHDSARGRGQGDLGVRIEAVVADPDHVWTVLEQVADVALIFWLLGSARGDPAQLAAIHGARLERIWSRSSTPPFAGSSTSRVERSSRPCAAVARSWSSRREGDGGSRSSWSMRTPSMWSPGGRDARGGRTPDGWLGRAASWSRGPGCRSSGSRSASVGCSGHRPAPTALVRVVLRRLVELVGEDDAAERDRRDNCEEDPVHGELAPDRGAVAPADHLAALVEPHRIGLGLLVAGRSSGSSFSITVFGPTDGAVTALASTSAVPPDPVCGHGVHDTRAAAGPRSSAVQPRGSSPRMRAVAPQIRWSSTR